MSRPALRLGATALLVLAGAASSLLAAGPRADRATTTSQATTTSAASSVVAFSGHGWGHGLGLSQWGAYGYARHGWTYDRILAHYYSGTTLGPAKVASVRVLIAQGKKTTVASAAPWKAIDATGATAALPAGTITLLPKLVLKGKPLQAPFTFVGKEPLTVDGKAYRGRIVVSSDGKQVQVVDTVGLEAYLKGVVPSEMPSAWSPEALKAQAVAARSYALANLAKARGYDLYGDTRSQVYGGVAAESPAASAAVDATRGEVVLYNDKVADTLFFSTSGGRTASAGETTGSSVPYLVPVADPYDSLSPYHDWGPVLFDGAKVAQALKLAGPITDLQTSVGASGRVKTVSVSSGDIASATLTASQLRSQLELRSTWFTSALLQLLPAAKTITYGGALSLTGLARGADALSLESKSGTEDWAPVGELLLDETGAFSTIVKPQAATQYRLAWGNVRAGLAKIAVAPRVDARPSASGVQGTEKPALAGAPVQLQQQNGATWTTLAATTTDATGVWSFTQPLAAGAYRVRCAPGHGLAPGVSVTFQAP